MKYIIMKYALPSYNEIFIYIWWSRIKELRKNEYLLFGGATKNYIYIRIIKNVHKQFQKKKTFLTKFFALWASSQLIHPNITSLLKKNVHHSIIPCSYNTVSFNSENSSTLVSLSWACENFLRKTTSVNPESLLCSQISPIRIISLVEWELWVNNNFHPHISNCISFMVNGFIGMEATANVMWQLCAVYLKLLFKAEVIRNYLGNYLIVV